MATIGVSAPTLLGALGVTWFSDLSWCVLVVVCDLVFRSLAPVAVTICAACFSAAEMIRCAST
jgi:hypothetical protein